MSGNTSSDILFARDRTYREGEIPPIRRFIFVSPGLHRTLGTPLIAGRDFSWTDINNKVPVAMVSEGFARDTWGSAQAALHKEIREGAADPWRQIVGVVGDVHSDGVEQKARTAAYFPMRMNRFWGAEFVQRTVSFTIRSSRAGSESFLSEIRRAIWSV